jgi:predicted nucleotidyltransferase
MLSMIEINRLKNDVINLSNIHPSRIFNIFIFGSTVYGTNSEKSDIDVIMVANNSVEAIELKGEKYNIHIYTPDKFKEDLEWHRINNLECIYAPTWAKIQENIKYDLDIDFPKLRHATSHISSNSWVKCKKKLEIGEYHTGIKSIFHSLRIPIFATQVATKGTIYDFEVANPIWEKLISKEWTWEELDQEFRELRNEILTDFRKVAEKL